MGSGRESVCIRLTENGVEGGWRTAWALELLLTALAVLALAPDAMVGADGGAHAAVSFGLITRGTSILPRPFRPYCRVGLPSPALSCSPHSHLQQGRPPPLEQNRLCSRATQKRRKRPTVKETMEEQYTRRRACIETHPHARTCTHIALNARPRKISAVCHKHAPGRSGTAPVSARIPRTGTRGRRESLQPAPAFPDIQHTRHLHPRLKQREAAMAMQSRRLARVLPPIPEACWPWARENAADWGALDSR